MESAKFGYQCQKLGEARRFLMAFYLKEQPRFGNATTCCQLALREFDSDVVRDKSMRAKIEELKTLMEVAAGTMTYDQRVVFGTTVDEVADWFAREFWLSQPPKPVKPAKPAKPANKPPKTQANRKKSVSNKKPVPANKKPVKKKKR